MIRREGGVDSILKLEVTTPHYMKSFQCIGSACTDNCCIGWDVDFDRESYQKYQKIKDPELSLIIAHNVYVKKDPYDPSIDYAGVRLKKHKRCPFLDVQNLCKIQSKKNAEFLSNVCYNFPRYLHKIGNRFELSATLSCPEVARMALGNPKGLELTNFELNVPKLMLTYDIPFKDDKQEQLFTNKLESVRRILAKREKSIEERLQALELHSCGHESKGDFEKVIANLLEWLKKLNPTDASLSIRYLDFSREAVKALELRRSGQKWQLNFGLFEEGLRKYVAPFCLNSPHILGNYFEHYYFKTLYPYGEQVSEQDLFRLSTVLYSLILLHLAGIGTARKALDEETVIQFLSAFTKAVEHHHTFMENVLADLNRPSGASWATLNQWLRGLEAVSSTND